jgi:hypothetical protein
MKPEVISLIRKIGEIVVKKGAVNFQEFAADIKEMDIDLWENLKRYLAGTWAALIYENISLEESNRAEVCRVLKGLDNENASVKEEVDEPINGMFIGLNLTDKIGFGTHENKTIGTLMREGYFEYLFKTIFEPTILQGANAAKTAQVGKIRSLIVQTHEFKDYKKEEGMTPAEITKSRKPFAEQIKIAMSNFRNADMVVTVLADGDIAIRRVPRLYLDHLRCLGFVRHNDLGWINRSYENIVKFSNVVNDTELKRTVFTTFNDWKWNPLDGTFTEFPSMTRIPPGQRQVHDGENYLIEVTTQSISAKTLPGQVVGEITQKNAENGLKLIAKFLPRIARMVCMDTVTNLLAKKSLTKEDKEYIRDGAQGFYRRGKVILAIDNVKQTIHHETADIAAAAAIFHKLIFHGSGILQNTRHYESWVSMLSACVTDQDIDNLVNQEGTRLYAYWRVDPVSKIRAMEQIFRAQNQDAKYFQWMEELLNDLFGLPSLKQIHATAIQDWGQEFLMAIKINARLNPGKDFYAD